MDFIGELKENLKKQGKYLKKYLPVYLKVLVLSALIGVVIGGFLGTVFWYTLKICQQTRTDYPWLLYFLPFGGLLIVWLYRVCGIKEDRGTNELLISLHSPTPLKARRAVLIYVSTAITHLFGGSAGREGAALQIGGSLGNKLGQKLKLTDSALNVMTMCGMGSVFSALFGMPVVAAVFSLEVISVGEMYYSALLPIALSCLIAAAVSGRLGVVPLKFSISHINDSFGWHSAMQVVGLAFLCAMVAILFCRTLRLTGRIYKHYLKNPYLRIFIGGLIVVLLNLLLRTTDYEGAGTDVITRAMSGQVIPEAFFLKIILTALTLECGFKGGEIVPTFFIGATFGCWMGGLLGLAPDFGAAIGLICLFCGVINCPISSLMIGFSMFGFQGAPFFLLACAVSYTFSGYTGLYSEQTILYGKLRAKYIGRKAE